MLRNEGGCVGRNPVLPFCLCLSACLDGAQVLVGAQHSLNLKGGDDVLLIHTGPRFTVKAVSIECIRDKKPVLQENMFKGVNYKHETYFPPLFTTEPKGRNCKLGLDHKAL
jgi:hypothetical protein